MVKVHFGNFGGHVFIGQGRDSLSGKGIPVNNLLSEDHLVLRCSNITSNERKRFSMYQGSLCGSLELILFGAVSQ